MAIQKPVIGAEIKMDGVNEAIKILDDSKVLIVGQYTDDPMLPTQIEGVQNLDQAFTKLTPSKRVTLQDGNGQDINETLHFGQLEDFTAPGMIAQSQFLSDLNSKQEDYQTLARRLSSNATFQKALTDPVAKEALLAAMRAMIQDLDKADAS